MSTKVKTLFKFRNSVFSVSDTLNHRSDLLFSKLNAWYETHQRYRSDRAALKQLLHMNNRELRDIGLTRADVVWASKLPKDKTATLELQKRTTAISNI